MHVNSGANTPHLWNYAYLRVEDMEIHVFLREGALCDLQPFSVISWQCLGETEPMPICYFSNHTK